MVNKVPKDISSISPITGGQMRAARAFLRWTANDLAKAANVGVMTVRRAEREDGVPKNMLVNNIDAIRRALEAAGIEFTNGDTPGVRLVRAKKGRPSC